jgi:hypothetical protein
MRGEDWRSGGLFSYVDLEARVPADHRLRSIRAAYNLIRLPKLLGALS